MNTKKQSTKLAVSNDLGSGDLDRTIDGVACSGDGDRCLSSPSETGSSSTGGSSLSKDEFVKKANALCNRERESVVAEFEAYLQKHKGSKRSEAEVFADMLHLVLVPVIKKEISEARALGTPEGNQAQVEAILKAEEEGAESVANLRSVSDGSQYENYFKTATKLAVAYGISACTHSR